MPASSGRPFDEIETWIFDLDNTLYPASCRLFDQIHARMQRFIAERLGLSMEAALVVQKSYFREHGTTMRGLMTVDRVDPHDFLAYVHDIDLSSVPADPVLAAALTALRGRKIVHTNGSVRHAERLLDHLGISKSFCGIVDIAMAGFEPKPAIAGYHELMRRHEVIPRDRADGRGHGQEPGPRRRARHDHGLGARYGRLGCCRLGGRPHPSHRRRSRPLPRRGRIAYLQQRLRPKDHSGGPVPCTVNPSPGRSQTLVIPRDCIQHGENLIAVSLDIARQVICLGSKLMGAFGLDFAFHERRLGCRMLPLEIAPRAGNNPRLPQFARQGCSCPPPSGQFEAPGRFAKKPRHANRPIIALCLDNPVPRYVNKNGKPAAHPQAAAELI